jgi:uncharacterized phage protein (TIGR02220 family)
MIIRNKSPRYTVIPNQLLEDERITWEAKGILAYLLSKPDAWELNASHLIGFGHAGREKIYRVLKELQDAGYASHNRKSDGRVEWEIRDTAQLEKPHAEKQHKANPRAEKPNEEKPNEEKPNEEKPNEANPHVLVNTERTVITESKVSTERTTNTDKVSPSETNQIFTYWKEVMKKTSMAKLTEKRRKSIQARLREGYSVDQIKQAIDGCAKSSYHMGQNDSGTVYDDLTLICRSGDKLEQFANNIGKEPPTGKKEQPGKRISAHDNFDNKQYIGTPTEGIWWMQ